MPCDRVHSITPLIIKFCRLHSRKSNKKTFGWLLIQDIRKIPTYLLDENFQKFTIDLSLTATFARFLNSH